MIDQDYKFEGDYCTSESVDVIDPLSGAVTMTYESYSSEEYSCRIDHD